MGEKEIIVSTQERPTMATEVRAWIGVGLAVLVQAGAGIWWAATLSEQNASMKQLLTEMRSEMKGYAVKVDVDRRLDEQLRTHADHEARIRYIERNARFNPPPAGPIRDGVTP